MAYKGDVFTFPLVAAGLGYLRNPLVVPLGLMENIRNWDIHELGVGKRGGSSIFDTISGNSRITGLKQFISAQGDKYILRATDEGKYYKDNLNTIKTGLSIRGDEVLAQGDFATHDKWVTGGDGEFNDTGGNLVLVGSGSASPPSTATQAKEDFKIPLKPNTLYELSYNVILADSNGGNITVKEIVEAAQILTVHTTGVKTTQFTTRSDATDRDFVLQGQAPAGFDVTLDDLSLKEVITPLVDISIYNKKAVITNGPDVPQVYTGLRFLEAPIAPVIGNAENGAGDCEDIEQQGTDGTHSVKVTFINSNGETVGSNASNKVTITNQVIDGKIKVTGVPFGPNEVTGRSIYMTEADSGTIYYKVTAGAGATIGDNTTTEYEIDITDAALAGFNEIPGDNTATTGTVSTDLGVEGIARPSVPTVAIAGPGALVPFYAGDGAGNVDDGTHSYVSAFENTDGVIGPIGTISSIIDIADKGVDGKVSLTEIPLGPTGTAKRHLYRTVAGNTGNYLFLGTVNDNITVIFTDNIADVDLGLDVLNENDFATTTKWSILGAWSVAAAKIRYIYTGGAGHQTGNFVQLFEDMALPPIPGHKYLLTYTMSNLVNPGNVTAFKAEEFGVIDVDLPVSNGTHTVDITAKEALARLSIDVYADGVGTFDIDDVFIRDERSAATPITSGDHTYQITFKNPHGETPGGAISETVTASAENGEVNISDIPLGPLGVIARIIYRTTAGGSQHKLLATIPDNVTRTYTDNIADAGLGDNIPITNTAAARPSDWIGTNNPKYAFEHAVGNTEGIIFFGCEDNPDQVYIIPDGSEDASDAKIKQFTFKSKSIKEKNVLVGGKEYGTNLFMFSQDASWLIDKTSLNVADWTYIKLPWKGGTINNKTLVAVNNDIHCMELDGNIYSLKRVQESGDTSIASLTRPTLTRPFSIDRWIKDNIDLSYSADFHGIFDEELQIVRWFMVRQGETEVDTALSYFVNFDRWVIHDNRAFNSGFSASSSTVVVNTNGTKTIATGDYGGNVWLLNQTTRDDESNGYRATFKLHPTYMPQGDIVRNRIYDWLFINQEINAGVDLGVQGFVDGSSITADSIECSAEYTRYKMGRIGRNVAVEIYNETAGDDVFINALIFYYELLDIPSE